MSSCRSRFLAALLVAMASVTVEAQLGDPDGALARRRVPDREMPCQPLPAPFVYDSDRCWVSSVGYRFDYLDGFVEGSGREETVQQGELLCDTCDNCCELAPPMNCHLNISVCDSRTFSVSPGVGVEVPLPRGVTGAAELQFGYNGETSHCWSVEVGCNCPPCVRTLYRAELRKITGVKYRILSRYRWHRELICDQLAIVKPGFDVWYRRRVEREFWDPYCSTTRESYVTGTRWPGAQAKAINLGPCPTPGNPGNLW